MPKNTTRPKAATETPAKKGRRDAPTDLESRKKIVLRPRNELCEIISKLPQLQPILRKYQKADELISCLANLCTDYQHAFIGVRQPERDYESEDRPKIEPFKSFLKKEHRMLSSLLQFYERSLSDETIQTWSQLMKPDMPTAIEFIKERLAEIEWKQAGHNWRRRTINAIIPLRSLFRKYEWDYPVADARKGPLAHPFPEMFPIYVMDKVLEEVSEKKSRKLTPAERARKIMLILNATCDYPPKTEDSITSTLRKTPAPTRIVRKSE